MCKQHALRIAWTIARSIAFLDFRVLRWKFTYDWKCVNTTYRVPFFCPLPASRKGLRLTLRSALFGEGGRDWRPCQSENSTENTLDSKYFARILFSRNFASAKFRENKTTAKWQLITQSFIDIGISCHCQEFWTCKIFLLTLFAKIKSSRKFPKVYNRW